MMKDFFDVTVLAVLQGVAEFLPVSSSGHLVVVQHLLEVPEPLRMRLEVFLHAGTLISIFAFYAARLRAICVGVVRRERAAWGYVAKLFVSALPAVAVYFLFREAIDALVGNVRMVGALLMFTGAVLVGTRYLPRGTREVGVLRALFMGLGQAIALLPGVSRSGMTLAAARGGRVDPERAAEFSFLMSAPLIVGGVLLELGKLFKGGAAGVAADLHWGVMAWDVPCGGGGLRFPCVARPGAEGTLVLALRPLLRRRRPRRSVSLLTPSGPASGCRRRTLG